MFDYYYYDLSKKKILFIVMLIIAIFVSLFYLYTNIFSESKNLVWLELKGTWITLKNDMSKLNNFDYYQVYIYINNYNFKCESKNESICPLLYSNSWAIKDFPVSFIWQDLKKSLNWDVSVDTYFLDEKRNKTLLNDILKLLISWNISQSRQNNKWYEKYFEYKKINESDKIILSEMEIICIEGIKNSIVPWTFDEENTIKTRVKEECSGLSSSIPMNWLYLWWDQTSWEREVNLILEIKELKVVYKFYVKEKWKFIEKGSEERYIKKSLKLDWIVTY